MAGKGAGAAGKSAGGLAAGETLTTAMAGGGAFCWIAAALYGYGSPEFSLARRWIFEQWRGPVAALCRMLYKRYGQHIAQKPWALRWLRPWFDLAVRQARR